MKFGGADLWIKLRNINKGNRVSYLIMLLILVTAYMYKQYLNSIIEIAMSQAIDSLLILRSNCDTIRLELSSSNEKIIAKLVFIPQL